MFTLNAHSVDIGCVLIEYTLIAFAKLRYLWILIFGVRSIVRTTNFQTNLYWWLYSRWPKYHAFWRKLLLRPLRSQPTLPTEAAPLVIFLALSYILPVSRCTKFKSQDALGCGEWVADYHAGWIMTLCLTYNSEYVHISKFLCTYPWLASLLMLAHSLLHHLFMCTLLWLYLWLLHTCIAYNTSQFGQIHITCQYCTQKYGVNHLNYRPFQLLLEDIVLSLQKYNTGRCNQLYSVHIMTTQHICLWSNRPLYVNEKSIQERLEYDHIPSKLPL